MVQAAPFVYTVPMYATIVNALAIVLGTIIGLVVGRSINDTFKRVVFTAVGTASVLIGISMALQTQRFLYLVLSLVLGGLVGTAFRVEDAIYGFGEWLKRSVAPRRRNVAIDAGTAGTTHSFAQGFLSSSVLFCVGALAILGSFQAGVEGRYDLLLTKSVMDGFVAILLTAAYGIGVGFSAVTVLVYQGVLTLLSSLLTPYVSPLMLSEISGVGGTMVVMIGFNLLEIRTVKTGDFLPALLFAVLFVLVDPLFGGLVL